MTTKNKGVPIPHHMQDYPESYTDAYTEEDKEKLKRVIDWLNAGSEHAPGWELHRSQRKLAKSSRVNSGTLSGVIRGRYPSSPSVWLDRLIEVINRDGEREEHVVTSFVETSVYRTVVAACKRAHMYRNFGVVAAAVGTGKTTAVKHYVDNNPNVYLIEATPDMNSSVLVNDLVAQTKAVVHKASRHSSGTRAEKTAAIIRALKDTDSLIILDEAETVTANTLEYLRRISDKSGIGVVLTGTERLMPMVRDKEGRFGQISSRVGFWPPVIKSITEEDAMNMLHGLLSNEVTLTPDLQDAFWQMCDGSARVLANALVPGVRDYVIKKNKELTPEWVFRVGEMVLGFKRTRRGEK